MGSDSSKPIPFNQMTAAELQNVRRRSMSDNNLTAPRTSPRATKPKFRRTLSLSKKRPKGGAVRPACPDHVVAGNLAHAQTRGYVEKCHKRGPWEKVWCVLRAGTLYVFTAESDHGAQDTLLLSDCTFRQYTEGYKHRQYVVEVTQKPYCPEYIAMETRQEMSDWLTHLKEAVMEASVEAPYHAPGEVTMETDRSRPLTYTSLDSSVLPSSEWDELYSKDTEHGDCFDDNVVLSPDTAQRELILEKKQRLLQEMLHQKQQLQDRTDKGFKDLDTERSILRQHSSLSDQQSPRSPSLETSPRQQAAHDEQQWRELVMLKQRKMSTELKVDTLRRILDSCESKNHKKAKLRFPKDLKRLKKSSSLENLCDGDGKGYSAEEVQHWVSQLQTLRNELGSLTSEIEEREQRHTWYPGLPVDGQRSTEATESRSISLLSERSLFRHNLSGGNVRKPSSSSVKSEGCFDEERMGSRRSGESPGSKAIYKTWEPRSRLHGQNSNNSIGEGKIRLKSQTSSSSTTEPKSILKIQYSGSSVGDTSQKTEGQTPITPGAVKPKPKLRAQDSNSSIATTASAASTAVGNTSLESKSENGSNKNLARLNVTDSPRSSRSARLQKITALGKKIPSLPSLRRGIFRKNNSCDRDDATSPILADVDRRCSYDIVQTQLPPIDCHKRASLDERLVLACQRSGDAPNSPSIEEEADTQPLLNQKMLSPQDPEVFHVVPPNSRRSSDGDAPRDKVSSNVSSPTTPAFNKADSLLSSVMQALHSIRSETDPGTRLRSQSTSGRMSSQNSETKYPCTSQTPSSEKVASVIGTNDNPNVSAANTHHSVSNVNSRHNVSTLTEAHVETDSGRGSPLSPDITSCHGSASPRSLGTSTTPHQTPTEAEPSVSFGLATSDTDGEGGYRLEQQRNSKLEINPQALANIAAFEQLIQERLKYF